MFFVLFTILTTLFCYVVIQKRKNSKVNQFPVPPGNILFGHILELKSPKDYLSKFNEYVKQYGSIVKLYIGLDTMIITDDYKFSQFIFNLNKGLKKSKTYTYLKPWLGSGLLISEGNEWKYYRKMLTPAFHFQVLKSFIPIFESVTDRFIEQLKKYDGKRSIDILPLASLCTLDIISESSMGIKLNAQEGENVAYTNNVKRMTEIIINRALSIFKLEDFSYRFTSDYNEEKKLLRQMHGFIDTVIANKKNDMTETNTSNERQGFLDLLLNYNKDGNLLTDREIREQVDMFMFAGHDTTATALSFTLYCLANHPEIQQKVLQEQIELFNHEENPTFSYQILQNMKYLENVIKESLRLYPTVPVIGRCTTEKIKFDGHIIDKNTNILILIYILHQNPEYFPEPEKFHPERFDEIGGHAPFCFLPFAAGPRNCIGQKFAMLELKTILSKIIRRFELLPAFPEHSLELTANIVLTSENGIKIGLKLRQ